jgi:hypothetical protein
MARAGSGWDLTALLNAADPKAPLAERHLWLVRLMEWLRRAPLEGEAERSTPTPVLRLKHLLNVLQRNEPQRAAVGAMLARIWREVDTVALFADFGFAPRMNFFGELGQRLRLRLLPITPETLDLGELFALLFPRDRDAQWLDAIDDDTLARLVEALGPMLAEGEGWRRPLADGIIYLAAAVRASGHSGALRQRMSPELLADDPFRQLASAAERLGARAADADNTVLLQESQYLRALLDACRRCADSVHAHLEQYGVSVDIVFEVDQLRARCDRIEAVLNTLLAPRPARELLHLIAGLARQAEERRGLRSAVRVRHYSLLARKVAERSAETGEHYITRTAPSTAACCAQGRGRRRGDRRHHHRQVALGALGLAAFWGGLLGRRQLRGQLRADPPAALDGGHQAACHDRHRPWPPSSRTWPTHAGGGFRGRGHAPDPLAGGRHLRQPDGRRAGGAARAARLAGWPARQLVGQAPSEYVLHSLTCSARRRCSTRPSPACCCSPPA